MSWINDLSTWCPVERVISSTMIKKSFHWHLKGNITNIWDKVFIVRLKPLLFSGHSLPPESYRWREVSTNQVNWQAELPRGLFHSWYPGNVVKLEVMHPARQPASCPTKILTSCLLTEKRTPVPSMRPQSSFWNTAPQKTHPHLE